MSPFYITFLVVLIAFATETNAQRCGPYEVWTDCGRRLACQRNCDSIRNPGSIVCTADCVAGCVCQDRYVRRSQNNRQCIPERSC